MIVSTSSSEELKLHPSDKDVNFLPNSLFESAKIIYLITKIISKENTIQANSNSNFIFQRSSPFSHSTLPLQILSSHLKKFLLVIFNIGTLFKRHRLYLMILINIMKYKYRFTHLMNKKKFKIDDMSPSK